MKKIVTILLSILACFTIVACADNGPSLVPPAGGGTEQGGTEQGGGTGNETENGGGNVVTPIQPGGDYNGNDYGK